MRLTIKFESPPTWQAIRKKANDLGIPAWKLRVTAGWVINPYTKKKEGHAYVTYYCEASDKWVVLDWCYLPNDFDVWLREDYKDNLMYGDVWFSFNEEYSWSKGLNTQAKKLLK